MIIGKKDRLYYDYIEKRFFEDESTLDIVEDYLEQMNDLYMKINEKYDDRDIDELKMYIDELKEFCERRCV